MDITTAWKESTQKIFWGVIVIAVAGILCTVYDYLSYGVKLISLLASMIPGGMGEQIKSFLTSFTVIGIVGKLVVVGGYVLYLMGLTQFATMQTNAEATFNILKVRKAIVILIGGFVASVVLGFIPFVGVVISIAVWVATLVSYYYMRNAFGVLMKCSAFSTVSQSGAQKLHVAAKANIRLIWLPLVTIGALLVMGLITLLLGKSASLEALQTIAIVSGIILVGITIYAVVMMIVALIYPFIGWYKIMNGGPGDGSQSDNVVDGQQVAIIPTSQDIMKTLSEKWSQIAFVGMVVAMIGLLLPRLFVMVDPLYIYDRTGTIYIVGMVFYLIGWVTCYVGFHILDRQQLYRITASYVKTIKTSVIIVITVAVVRNLLELLVGMSIVWYIYYALWLIEIIALTCAYFRMWLAFGALSKFPNMDDQMRGGFCNLKNGVVALLIIMALEFICWIGNVFFDFYDGPWMNFLKMVAIIVALVFFVIGWLRITKGSTVPASEEAMAAIPTAQEQFKNVTGQIAPLLDKSKTFAIANKKMLGIGAGAAVVVGLLIWLITSLFSGSSVVSVGSGGTTPLMGMEIPEWKEFVSTNEEEGPCVYKAPDESSPHLMMAVEDVEGDAMDSFYSWSDESRRSGYNYYDSSISRYQVSPIIGEDGDFYKILICQQWKETIEGYIKKSDCNVVMPTPITKDVLDKVCRENHERDAVVEDGQLKGLLLSSYLEDFDEPGFSIGELCDGCIVFTQMDRDPMLTMSEENTFKVFKGDDDYYYISYGESYMEDGMLDPGKLNTDQITEIYNTFCPAKGKRSHVAYYFPDVYEYGLTELCY